MQIATLDPFAGDKKALDDELDDTTAVLDAFHVVKLGTQAVDEVRRRVQQTTLEHRDNEATRSIGSATSSAPGGRTSPSGRSSDSRTRSR